MSQHIKIRVGTGNNNLA